MAEPKWMMTETQMLAALAKFQEGTPERAIPYSCTAWALWQIKDLQERVNDLGEYADRLEAEVDTLRKKLSDAQGAGGDL